MFNPAIIIYERASFARDLEYLRNIVEDSVTMESLNTLDRYGKGVSGIFETAEDPEEAELEKVVDEIPTDKEFEKEEIDRIVKSDKDMSIDDIMGVSDEEDAAVDLADDLTERDENN